MSSYTLGSYVPLDSQQSPSLGRDYVMSPTSSRPAWEKIANNYAGNTSSSPSDDIFKWLKENSGVKPLDPTMNIWENTLNGRGNLLGMVGTGTQLAGSLFNMLDIGGERDAAKKQMKAQTALARQQYDNNEYQIGLAKSSAAARNEAAQKFGQPSLTPSTTMMG